MSVDPSRRSQERAVRAALVLWAQAAGPVALRGAGERLAREAEAYLAVVDVFRAEGFEPRWKSDATVPCRFPHRLDGANEVSAAGKGSKG